MRLTIVSLVSLWAPVAFAGAFTLGEGKSNYRVSYNQTTATDLVMKDDSANAKWEDAADPYSITHETYSLIVGKTTIVSNGKLWFKDALFCFDIIRRGC